MERDLTRQDRTERYTTGLGRESKKSVEDGDRLDRSGDLSLVEGRGGEGVGTGHGTVRAKRLT